MATAPSGDLGAPPDTPEQWTEAARQILARVRAAATTAGFPPDPALRLVAALNACPSYDDEQVTISFGLPGDASVHDRMFWCYLAQATGQPGPDQARRFAAVSLPLAIAHETAHHLRHLYRAHTQDHFIEEQVAQVLGLSWVAHSPEYVPAVAQLRRLCRQAVARLPELTGDEAMLAHGFGLSAGELLADEHRLPWRRLHAAERFAALHQVTVDQVLRDRGWVSNEELTGADAELATARAVFDREYMRDIGEYWHVGIVWLDTYFTHFRPAPLPETMQRYLGPDRVA